MRSLFHAHSSTEIGHLTSFSSWILKGCMTDLQQSFLNAFHTSFTLKGLLIWFNKVHLCSKATSPERKRRTFHLLVFSWIFIQLYLYLSTLYSLMSIVFPSILMIVQSPPHFHYFLLDFSHIYKSFLLHCSRIILTSSHVLRRVKRYTRVLCVRWCECLFYLYILFILHDVTWVGALGS